MDLEAQLIARVQSGDREALAQFVQRFEPLIRARFQEQFAAIPQHAIFDSSDFFATVMRRVDSMLANRASATSHVSPLDVLERIMIDAAADYARSLKSGKAAPHAPFSVALPNEVGVGPRRLQPTAAQWQAIAASLDATDSEILRLRANGAEHRIVASALGMSVAAVRMRWHRIVSKFRDSVSSELTQARTH